MALKHFDRVKETASNKPNAATAFNLPDSGATGFRSFDSVLASADTCPYVATNGTDWEVGIGTFTAGTPDTLTRTTILSSSTGSAIDFSGGGDVSVFIDWPAAFGAQSLMTHAAATAVTTADPTVTLNTMHVLDISGLTADRTFTLPTGAAIGDRVGVIIEVGETATGTRELLIKTASGDKINGVDCSTTEWSALFITGESLIFRCVNAANDWIVEHDGRIPCAMVLRLTTASSGAETGGTFYAPTALSGVWTVDRNVGGCAAASTSRFTVRRNSAYQMFGRAFPVNNITDANYFTVRVWDGTTTYAIQQINVGATAAPQFSYAGMAAVSSGYLEFNTRAQESNKYCQTASTFCVTEVLP